MSYMLQTSYRIRLRNVGIFKRPFFILAVYRNGKWIDSVGFYDPSGAQRRIVMYTRNFFFYLKKKNAVLCPTVKRVVTLCF